MDSRPPAPEAARPPAAVAHPRAWLAAIALWTAFLGAALNLLAALLVLPPELAHALDWHALSVLFLGTWLATAVSVGLALVLALPLLAPRGGGDGR